MTSSPSDTPPAALAAEAALAALTRRRIPLQKNLMTSGSTRLHRHCIALSKATWDRDL